MGCRLMALLDHMVEVRGLLLLELLLLKELLLHLHAKSGELIGCAIMDWDGFSYGWREGRGCCCGGRGVSRGGEDSLDEFD